MERLDVLWAVISYNNHELTLKAVQSLRRQTVPCRIVVWDNNSPDGSGDQLAARFVNTDNVTVVKSGSNLLWTPAVNAVAEQYWHGETYFGITNNDVELPEHATEHFIRIVSRPEVGVVAPTGSGFGGPQDFVSHHGPYHEADLSMLGPKRTTYVVGACTFMRREVYDQVGPFDEDMPLGADDHDYSIRLKQHGYQIWVDESVYASHVSHASETSPDATAVWSEWGQKSWQVFQDKWAGYYLNEEEAIKCHWGGIYYEGYDK